MPVDHYENFPVASVLLPAHLRPPVEAIYAFARSADDLADEGNVKSADRLAALWAYEKELDLIEAGALPSAGPAAGLFSNLGKAVRSHSLPLQPLRDLLSAFRQDVQTTRYADFPQLLDYCSRSANPVGRLMLHLYHAGTPRNLADSDAICSALQLINFWQDTAIDWEKRRIYLPQEDLQRFGVGESHLDEARVDGAWQSLMRFEVERARSMMLSGAPLACRLPGRVGWELRLVVQGGLRILERIEMAEYDMFHRRPKLGKYDWMTMGWRAWRMKAG